MSKQIIGILDSVNVESRDDGNRFVITTRIENICALLTDSVYKKIHHGSLAYIYSHSDRNENDRIIIISCHIDSLYDNHFHETFGEDELLGSFDNSICNAILLYLMKENLLTKNVIVSFTGDEEEDARGAVETLDFIGRNRNLWQNLEAVITLDVTSEYYACAEFTIENYFIRKAPASLAYMLHFDKKRNLKNYLKRILTGVKFIKDSKADPDESWEYDEYNLNCFSFCLPSAPHPEDRQNDDWMESSKGILVKIPSLSQYANALGKLCHSISSDLTNTE